MVEFDARPCVVDPGRPSTIGDGGCTSEITLHQKHLHLYPQTIWLAVGFSKVGAPANDNVILQCVQHEILISGEWSARGRTGTAHAAALE